MIRNVILSDSLFYYLYEFFRLSTKYILVIGNQCKTSATAVGNEKLRHKQNYRNWGTRYFSEKIIHLFSSSAKVEVGHPVELEGLEETAV